MGLKIVGLQEREISRVYLTGGKSKADNTRLPRGGERAFNGFLGCISRALERRKEGRNEQHESYFTGQERRRKGLIIFSVDTFFLFLDWDFRFIFFTLLSTTAISVIPRSALGGGGGFLVSCRYRRLVSFLPPHQRLLRFDDGTWFYAACIIDKRESLGTEEGERAADLGRHRCTF